MLEKQYFIPEPEEFIAEAPLTEALKKIKKERDQEIRDAIAGRIEKMLIIVGPCSAHEPAPTLEYISRLGKLNEKVKDKLVIVPRIYTNKPRTKGVGYKGMFLQPDPEGAADIARGIRSIRALHLAAMNESIGLNVGGRNAVSRKHGVRGRFAFLSRGRCKKCRRSTT